MGESRITSTRNVLRAAAVGAGAFAVAGSADARPERSETATATAFHSSALDGFR